jgi:hypothetical protein
MLTIALIYFSSSTESFLAAAAAANTNQNLGEENRGHMLLKKMGKIDC